MSKRQVLGAIFACAGIVVLLFVAARSHRSEPSVRPAGRVATGFRAGDRAPDFQLRSVDGKDVKLSEFRGKPLLLNFWATWCVPCKVEMPWLVELDARYRMQGLQIVGVSMDDAGATEDVGAFARDKGVRYEVLLGNSATADAYGGVRFMPQSFFINPEGKIMKATTGLTNKQDLEDGVRALLGLAENSPQTTTGSGPGRFKVMPTHELME